MRGLKDEGGIQPFTAFGDETAQMDIMGIRGNNPEIRNYNEINIALFAVHRFN